MYIWPKGRPQGLCSHGVSKYLVFVFWKILKSMFYSVINSCLICRMLFIIWFSSGEQFIFYIKNKQSFHLTSSNFLCLWDRECLRYKREEKYFQPTSVKLLYEENAFLVWSGSWRNVGGGAGAGAGAGRTAIIII